MGVELVEALVVERGHQLGIGRCAVRLDDGKRPFLLLAGCETVAEGLPFHVQVLVGQRFLDGGVMYVVFAVLHPSVGEQQAVGVLILVGELAVDQFVADVGRAALDDLVAAEDGVHHVHVLVGGTHLHGDGLAVVGELLAAGVEPFVCLGDRSLVVEREDDEILLDGVLLADGREGVAAALERGHGYEVVSLGFLPAAVVEAVAHLAFQVGAACVLQVEGYLRLIFIQNLFGQRDAEGCLSVTQGYRHHALMRLASLIGHVGGDDEVVEHGMLRLRHHEGDVGRELSLVVGHGLAFGQLLVVAAGADVAVLPVARVAHPPEGHAAHHLVLHRGTLHGHAGIAAHVACGHDGVASLIVLRHAGDVHLESRPLVFLHAERVPLLSDVDGELSGQALRGQRERCRGRAELVGGDGLFLHDVVVGVLQADGKLFVGQCAVVVACVVAVEDDGGVHRLSRAIDAAVGEYFYVAVIVNLIVMVASPVVHLGAGIVGRGVCTHTESAGVLLGLVHALAVARGLQRGFASLLTPSPAHLHRGVLHGLAGGGVHHGDALRSAFLIDSVGRWQGQRQYAQVADEVEAARGACGGLALELQHVDAHG